MGITRVSINHPVFVTMVMVALCVLGLCSYSKLGLEQMPDISFPGAWARAMQDLRDRVTAVQRALPRDVCAPTPARWNNDNDQPAGLLSDSTRDALVRVEGRVRDPRRFAEVVVAHRNGHPLRLADLGQLVERELEPESLARLNGQPALSFNVFKPWARSAPTFSS
jgi:multidrug efflux pump subunit AcrB